MSKFGKSIGIWKVKLEELEFELEPTMEDIDKFRELSFDERNKKNRRFQFAQFIDFMVGLIQKAYPDEAEENIRKDVSVYLIPLYEEANIAFKYTTKEEVEQARVEGFKELKKQIGSV